MLLVMANNNHNKELILKWDIIKIKVQGVGDQKNILLNLSIIRQNIC